MTQKSLFSALTLSVLVGSAFPLLASNSVSETDQPSTVGWKPGEWKVAEEKTKRALAKMAEKKAEKEAEEAQKEREAQKEEKEKQQAAMKSAAMEAARAASYTIDQLLIAQGKSEEERVVEADKAYKKAWNDFMREQRERHWE